MEEITHENKTREERKEEIRKGIDDYWHDEKKFDEIFTKVDTEHYSRKLVLILKNPPDDFKNFLHKDSTILSLRLSVFGLSPVKSDKENGEGETKKIINVLNEICKSGFNNQTENYFKNNIIKYSNRILNVYENYLDTQDWKYVGLTKDDYSRKKPIVDIGKYLKKYSDLPKEKAIIVKDLLIKNFSVSYMIHKGFLNMKNYLLDEKMKYIDELILTKRELFEKSNISEKEIILKDCVEIVKKNNKEYWRLFAYKSYITQNNGLSSDTAFFKWVADITENNIDWNAIKKVYLSHKRKKTLTIHKF